MARDDEMRHTDGTEPPHRRRPRHWSDSRPAGSRPGRPRPTGSRPAGTRRTAR
ncbi:MULTISPECIES: hypothetical protein [Micromonospora]|uniref:hypothetical protein n=1 Tax=Micromonospora TaxID=1873 RepID=UPI000AA07AE1|nr:MULTISPECIES: hypothetical protein [Micromonospora]WFE94145.1 hypothetical protein O7612_22605 [Micromonospora sp. WMMD987]